MSDIRHFVEIFEIRELQDHNNNGLFGIKHNVCGESYTNYIIAATDTLTTDKDIKSDYVKQTIKELENLKVNVSAEVAMGINIVIEQLKKDIYEGINRQTNNM